jgi:predicted SnoaL-like aldol condensation-catalyzing enzyme
MIRSTLAFFAAGLIALAGGTSFAGNTPQEEANKQVVLDFYEKALNQKDFDAASKHLGSRYTQHNPRVADGPEAFKGFLQMLREKSPTSRNEIKRVFADGDYVILHVHAKREPGARGTAVVDIYRLENGKIVEHWDVLQEVPEKSANDNTMF